MYFDLHGVLHGVKIKKFKNKKKEEERSVELSGC